LRRNARTASLGDLFLVQIDRLGATEDFGDIADIGRVEIVRCPDFLDLLRCAEHST